MHCSFNVGAIEIDGGEGWVGEKDFCREAQRIRHEWALIIDGINVETWIRVEGSVTDKVKDVALICD